MGQKSYIAFTFIELIFVILIVGVLIGISVPNLKQFSGSLQIEGFSSQLQGFINYLRERSIVERKNIYLYVGEKEYEAKIEGETQSLKTYAIPKDIKVEIEKESQQVSFYPDGSIEPVRIKLSNRNNQKITLTTEGVFGGAKILPEK